ncbi:hypothetical protein [Embleya sp. NPDC020630]|uniref:hypothetical protein n=1 Tax=Embleya sp. NPDC020630 TaxID=3363979 RepID=UPI0037B4B7E7
MGGVMFVNAMEALGKDASAVRGYWLSGGDMKDNLDSFNAGMQHWLSAEEAARNTFTGKIAVKYGFTNVEFRTLEGAAAEYTKVEVIFRK